MGLDNIFALFGFSKDEDDEKGNKKMEKELSVYKETPHFKLGMFYKLIMNGTSFKNQIIDFFSKTDEDLNVEGINDAGEFMMFTRAYIWIEGFKFRSKIWRGDLGKHSNDNFLVAVKISINYFESTEEFEKCAHLKKIQDLVEKNIKKEQKNLSA